jgi:phage tail protein X
MMLTYKALNDDRLDQIVFKHYGTLEVYIEVLESNDHLMNKVILEQNDIVNLPVLNTVTNPIKEVETLW